MKRTKPDAVLTRAAKVAAATQYVFSKRNLAATAQQTRTDTGEKAGTTEPKPETALTPGKWARPATGGRQARNNGSRAATQRQPSPPKTAAGGRRTYSTGVACSVGRPQNVRAEERNLRALHLFQNRQGQGRDACVFPQALVSDYWQPSLPTSKSGASGKLPGTRSSAGTRPAIARTTTQHSKTSVGNADLGAALKSDPSFGRIQGCFNPDSAGRPGFVVPRAKPRD